jgi:hypothetical protein
MITKAIVEEIISPYKVRVRIPLLDRPTHTPLSTKTQDLNTATICTLPNCYINLQVGDVVFVGFEDNTAYKAVVLGHLCKEAVTTYADMILNTLEVNVAAKLPANTSIGNITATQLAYLEGLTDNIQGQLNSLKQDRDRLIKAVFPQ